MSKTGKAPTAGNGGSPELNFEEAIRKLEAVVDAMEGDDLPLEKLMAHFEEGTRLSRICQAKLKEAEMKIQQLEKDAAGQPVLKPAPFSEPSQPE